MSKTKESILDGNHQNDQINIIECLNNAVKNKNKSIISQIKEIIQFSFLGGKLSPEEYYYYNLFDDEQLSLEEKKKFVGKKQQTPLYLACNTPTWWSIAHDKLAFYAVMKGFGFPVPEIQAVLDMRRKFGSAQICRNRPQIVEFLRNQARYPIFGKPVSGMWSERVINLRSFNPEAETLTLGNGRVVALAQLADELADQISTGYLFQEALRPHPKVQDICGDRIATVRMVVILTDNGPEILHGIWKLPAGENMADNFWRSGNLLAYVDTKNGHITRVVRGVGPQQDFPESHPDTGVRLLGSALPDWDAAHQLCLDAAISFPELRWQAWDVALCDRGPVLLELNIGGDFNLPQVASGRGLMDQRFCDFLASCQQTKQGFWMKRSGRKMVEGLRPK